MEYITKNTFKSIEVETMKILVILIRLHKLNKSSIISLITHKKSIQVQHVKEKVMKIRNQND